MQYCGNIVPRLGSHLCRIHELAAYVEVLGGERFELWTGKVYVLGSDPGCDMIVAGTEAEHMRLIAEHELLDDTFLAVHGADLSVGTKFGAGTKLYVFCHSRVTNRSGQNRFCRGQNRSRGMTLIRAR